jgi:curli biogenesis system outer membrane secretion channel CsgG
LSMARIGRKRSGPALWCVTAVTCLVLLCSSASAQVRAPAPKKRVAVLNFEDDSGGSAAASQAFGADAADVGKGISAQIIEKLITGGKYTVVDRSAVKALLEEQNGAQEGEDAYSTAARIGRMLGLDAMIIGALTRFGPDAATKGGGHLPGVGTRKSKAYVDITARVLDMTTGQLIGGFTATGESTGSAEVIHINGPGRLGSTPEILSGAFANSLLGEATRNAVGKIAEQLDSFAAKIPTLKLEIDGLVADVAGNSVTLNVGKKTGVQVGDKLAILREIRAANDAATEWGTVVEHVGEATVTEVGDVYATAIFSGSGQVRVGDRVRSVANSQSPSH